MAAVHLIDPDDEVKTGVGQVLEAAGHDLRLYAAPRDYLASKPDRSAGVLLVLLGVTGMGTAVKYLPRPVVIGFTNGIAVLIASTQLRDFFGVDCALRKPM